MGETAKCNCGIGKLSDKHLLKECSVFTELIELLFFLNWWERGPAHVPVKGQIYGDEQTLKLVLS